jgi:hypothetical protein
MIQTPFKLHYKRLFISLFFSLWIFSCSKESPVKQSDIVDVYVAGYDGKLAVYWKNGVETALTDGSNFAIASSIFVSGTDVYVAGAEQNLQGLQVAKVWRNGNPISLADGSKNSEALSIYVVENNVYVAGYEYTSIGGAPVPKYWKNNVPVILSDSIYGMATSIFVSGNDVYVSGHTSKNLAIYWKNDSETVLTTGPSAWGQANSIFISGGDVYVAGSQISQNIRNYDIAKYWKNGVGVELTNGTDEAYLNSIVVSGNDVYAAGSTKSPDAELTTAAYWKNGVAFPFLLLNGYSTGKSIAVSGNDVYVVGFEVLNNSNYVSKLWKKGVAGFLSDGTKNSKANSIFLVNKPN